MGRVSFEKDPTAPGGYRIGDTEYDLLMSKSAKVDFIFAEYGFKVGIKKYRFRIKKFEMLKKIFEK